MAIIMKQKLLLINSYLQALAFLLFGGLIIVMSFFNTYEALGKAVKIAQEPEYEFIRHSVWGWQTDEGAVGWYFISFGIVFIISLVTVLLCRKAYSKRTYWLLSCAFIPLGIADFSIWIIYGIFHFTLTASIDALLFSVFFLIGFVYFIITLVFLIKDICKLTKALKE